MAIHKDFKAEPYWWEAYRPTNGDLADLPVRTGVAVIGAGYAGLSCARTLAMSGVECCVLDALDLGQGASTRNAGHVSGGVSVGKSFTGRKIGYAIDAIDSILASAADAFSFIEELISSEGIACNWEKRGRFIGAWTPHHYERLVAQSVQLNKLTHAGAYAIPKVRQREEVASDFYYGGLVVERAAKLHPALYYRGLLEVVRRHKVPVLARAGVRQLTREPTGWRLRTVRGELIADNVVVATNGYTRPLTPALRRRLIPISSHIIATEEFSQTELKSLIPNGRTLSDTKRVLCYYRQSPDGKRMIFGSRPRFTSANPEAIARILHRWMTDRFPQLDGIKVTHCWTGNVAFTFDALPHTGIIEGMHYALGCNGSGVAMMTYLGHETARRIVGCANKACGFELPNFPTMPFYRGDPKWVLPILGNYYRLRDALDRAVPTLPKWLVKW